MGQSASYYEEASRNGDVLTTNVVAPSSNANGIASNKEITAKDALISDGGIEIGTGRSSMESSSSIIEEEEKNGANANDDEDDDDYDNDIIEDSSASFESEEDADDAADVFLDPNATLLTDRDDYAISTESVAGFANRSSNSISSHSSTFNANTDVNTDANADFTPPVTTSPISNISPTGAGTFNTKNISTLSDVLNLTNKDIKTRIQSTKVSIEAVKQANAMIIQHHLHRGDDAISWYHDSNTAKRNKICNIHSTSSAPSSPRRSGSGAGSSSSSNENGNGNGNVNTHNNSNGIHTHSLSQEQAQAQELALEEYAKTHMELALFILKISPILKSIRFKMVPAKISEGNFWNAVFYLLLTEGEQLQLQLQIQEEELGEKMKQVALVIDCEDGFDATVSGTANETANASGGMKPLYNPADGQQVYQLLLNKNRKILQLQQRILQLQQDLDAALQSKPQSQSQSQSETDECGKEDSHGGKWIMEKESQEFLALDEEIKSKLRDGKEQRLRDVKEQMKFIIDSDDAKDTRGQWDCCKSRDYTSPCAC
jgi:hypothetical protein